MATEDQAVMTPEEKVAAAPEKWHGALKMVINCSIDKAWNTSADFCGMRKWIETVEICERVEGELQKPGCVRYMSGTSFPRADGSKSWAREKLLTFNDENRSMSYIMLDNNFGLSEYVSTYKMQDLGGGAVLVDWSFEVNPIPGSEEKKTADYMTGVYKTTLEKLEALTNSTSSETTTSSSKVSSSGEEEAVATGDANVHAVQITSV